MTVEELYAKLDVYKKRLKERIVIFLIITLVITAFCVYYAAASPKIFIADAVFHPESAPKAQAASPFAEFFPTETDGGGGEIIGVLQSRTLSEKVASQMYGPKKNVLLAHVILKKDEQAQVFPQLGPSEIDELDNETKIIRAGNLIRTNLTVEVDENGFISMMYNTPSSAIGEFVCTTYIELLSEYYEEQKTEKAKMNIEFFSYRADSLKKELDKAAYGIASHFDENKYGIRKKDEVYLNDLEMKQRSISRMYLANIQSREEATAQLQRETPIIQILDYPVPPFRSTEPSVVILGVLGLILGLIAASFWVFKDLFLREVLALIEESLKEEN